MLRRVLRVTGQSDLVSVQVGSTKHTVLVREIQKHLTRGDLFHVDFLEVNMNETVTTAVSLIAVNEAGVDPTMGTAVLSIQEIEIEALPDDLVSEIEVDLSLLQEVHDQILVGQLTPPSGVTILTDPEMLVARVRVVHVEEEEDDGEEEDMFAPAADTVEVIAKGKEDEEF
jgi:large subunit ribosomal protein L25